MKKQTFLEGALILALGSLTSRVLGAVYRFILPWIMGGGEAGAEGMGLFQMAYPIYQIALALSSVGVPLAVSKLISEKVALGDGRGALKVFRTAFIFLGAIGFFLSVVMFWGAGFYAERVIQVPQAALTIAAMAPAVFFVSIMSAYRGFFQGLQNMTPHAVSQVVEQVIRIATMFILAAFLLGRGLEFAAAGANFGAVTGAVAGLLYLGWTFFRRRKVLHELEATRGPSRYESSSRVIGRIVELAVPISLAAIVMPLMNQVDAALVPIRLQAAGYSVQEATVLYGDLSAYAGVFINLPAVLTGALAVSLVPSVSEALALRDRASIVFRSRAALRLTFIIALPAMVGLYLLARQLPDMFWGRPQAGGPLAFLSAVALFFPVQQVSSGVLQGLGLPAIPMRNLFVGAALKLGVTWYLTALPLWGAKGAALGTVVGFLVASSLNLASLQQRVGSVFELGDTIMKPVISVVVMGLTVKGAYAWAFSSLGSVRWATSITVLVGVLVYSLTILVVGGIKKRDFEMIPRYGPRLAALLERTGLLKG